MLPRKLKVVGASVAVSAALVGVGSLVKIAYFPPPPVAVVTTTTSGGSTTSVPASTTTTAPVGSLLEPPAGYFTQSMFTAGDPGNTAYASAPTNWPQVTTNNTASAFAALTSSLGTWFNTQPMYYAASGVTPNITMQVTSGCNNFVGSAAGMVPSSIPVPSYASLNGSTDSPLAIYQPGGNEYEIWQASQVNSTTYSGCWGGSMPMSSSTGVFQYSFGRSATGISEIDTMISENDVYQALLNFTSSSSLNHTLAVAIGRCNYSIFPADRGDCGSDAGQPSEGSFYRFAPNTTCGSACSSASNVGWKFATLVFNTILKHGMVVTDYAAGTVAFEMEQETDWAAQGNTGTDPITTALNGAQLYQVVAGLPWSSLQQIVPPGCTGTWMGASVSCPS